MFFWLNNKSGDFYPVVNKYFIIKNFEEVEVIEDFFKSLFSWRNFSAMQSRGSLKKIVYFSAVFSFTWIFMVYF